MSQAGYLALAIGVIALFIALFVILFLIYRRTPAPKGYEERHPEEGLCGNCTQKGCSFYSSYHQEEKENGR